MEARTREVEKELNRATSKEGAGVPCEEVGNKWSKKWWPLNPCLAVDWRDPETKDYRSDWIRCAKSAVLELEVTACYRQELLDSSLAAAYLRRAFKNAMDPFCARRSQGYFDSTDLETLEGWCYYDPFVPGLSRGM